MSSHKGSPRRLGCPAGPPVACRGTATVGAQQRCVPGRRRNRWTIADHGTGAWRLMQQQKQPAHHNQVDITITQLTRCSAAASPTRHVVVSSRLNTVPPEDWRRCFAGHRETVGVCTEQRRSHYVTDRGKVVCQPTVRNTHAHHTAAQQETRERTPVLPPAPALALFTAFFTLRKVGVGDFREARLSPTLLPSTEPAAPARPRVRVP
jgi:hypothetical protein